MASAESLVSLTASIGPLFKARLIEGDVYNVVSRKWWVAFSAWAGVDPDNFAKRAEKSNEPPGPPGPINNEELVVVGSPFNELKKPLSENIDFSLVPNDAYKILQAEFKGGPSIERKVVALGIQRLTRINLYPLFLTIQFADPTTGDPQPDKKFGAFAEHESLEDVLAAFYPGPTGTYQKGKKCGRVWCQKKRAAATAAAAPGGPSPAAGESETKSESKSDQKDELEWSEYKNEDMESPLELFELPLGFLVMVEYTRTFPTSSTAAFTSDFPRKSTIKNWREFTVGDKLDATDNRGTWYESTIMVVEQATQTTAARVRVHYSGWDSKFDEWIDYDHPHRFAPLGTKTSSSDSYGSSYSSYDRYSETPPAQRGAVGLRNLGNTCFMNSTLQCLSHTAQLTDFFVQNKHLKDLNRSNPLGWKGKIADEYAALVHELWGGKYSSVAPRRVKMTIGEFQPRFSGYEQHDSSELLSFLLDGLHEDLNRIKNKPATEKVEDKGRSDSVVATESWERHRLRNNSVVVDLCQGQLKSTVRCPDCKRVSTIFDPFMLFSVPLPSSPDTSQAITVIRAFRPGRTLATAQTRGAPNVYDVPRKYVVNVPKIGSILDLKNAVAKASGLEVKSLSVVEVYNNTIQKQYEDYDKANFGGHDILVVFELPELIAPLTDAKDVKDPKDAKEAKDGERKEPTDTAEGKETKESKSETKEQSDDASKVSDAPAAAPRDPKMDRRFVKISLVNMRCPYNDRWDPFGFPCTLMLSPNELRSITLGAIRERVREALTPCFVGGVWPEGWRDAEMFQIYLMDKLARSTKAAVFKKPSPPPKWIAGTEKTDEQKELERKLKEEDDKDDVAVLNLLELSKGSPFSLGVYWYNEGLGRYHLGRMALDASAGGGDDSDDDDRTGSMANRGPPRRRGVQLSECFDAFAQEETLQESEAWYCSTCRKHQCASKKFDLWLVPDVLIVHLKRFAYSRWNRDKIETLVEFPISGLDMSKWIVNPAYQQANQQANQQSSSSSSSSNSSTSSSTTSTGDGSEQKERKSTSDDALPPTQKIGDCIYDLYAVSNHYGGLGGGHYTAYCKNPNDGQWYDLDDSSVSVMHQSVITPAAYVLFYAKRNPTNTEPLPRPQN